MSVEVGGRSLASGSPARSFSSASLVRNASSTWPCIRSTQGVLSGKNAASPDGGAVKRVNPVELVQ